MSPRRFVILPIEVAGYAARLRQGLENLGEEAEFWCLGSNPFGYRYPSPSRWSVRLMIRISKSSLGSDGFRGVLYRLMNLPIKVVVVLMSYRRGLILVCMTGRSLFGGWDLWYAKWRGVKVISVYLGSDSRPAYLNGVHMNVGQEPDWRHIHRDVMRMSRQVRRTEMRSTYVVCSPASAQFLRRPFVNWFCIGMPIDAVSELERDQNSVPAGSRRVRVLHAPSRERQKGSKEFSDVITGLEAGGIELEYVQLRNSQNSEVREQIANSDLVIDELYSDTFFGGIGVEAAAAGVPVVTFGYAEELFAEVCGVINYPRRGYADPSEMNRVVARAITDEDWRQELSEEQSAFVRSYWSSEAVASRYIDLANGRLCQEWVVDPGTLTYLWGFGMPQSLLETRLREYILRFGLKGLGLVPGGALDLAARQISKVG